MAKELERLKSSADAAASRQIRNELAKSTGKELAQLLYLSSLPSQTDAETARLIVSECMRRLEALGDGEP